MSSLFIEFRSVSILIIAMLFIGCSKDPVSSGPDRLVFRFDFSEESNGWESLFTNYSVGEEDFFELTSDYLDLPEPLDTTGKALYISGNNHSDDLNMYYKRLVNGLRPNTSYKVEFEVTFATEVPTGCFGVGGSPGESVTVHTTASAPEPMAVVDQDHQPPYYRLNLAESFGGSWYDMTRIGNVSNSRDCEQGFAWETKELESADNHMVKTDSNGRAWLLVGTRSGFEATTRLYYMEITATFTMINEQ